MANHTFSLEQGCITGNSHRGKALGIQPLKGAGCSSNVKYKAPARVPLVLSDASGTFYISTY